jgi:hypothetical protein
VWHKLWPSPYLQARILGLFEAGAERRVKIMFFDAQYQKNLARFLDEVIGPQPSSRPTQQIVVKVVEVTITEILSGRDESASRAA